MKKLAIILFTYIVCSVIYIISGLNLYSACYRSTPNYKNCFPIGFGEMLVQLPGNVISKYAPVKFTWSDNNKGTGVGNYSFGGIKIGNTIIFQTWSKFQPI